MKRALMTAAALSLLGTGAALAGPQFSADAVQTQPGQELRSGKLYVSDKGMRFEHQQDGQPVVQVLLPSQKVMRVLFPLTRTYMEIEVPNSASLMETRPDVPCKASPEVECIKEGDDPANAGVQRWTIRTRMPPGIVRVWWDAKRKMAVREEYMDGRVMQATLRGSESYEGRAVEGWEIVFLTPNGRYHRLMSLYSPELGVAVVEQIPGNSLRQLRNIQMGAPDAKLFALPEDYKKVETAVDSEVAVLTPREEKTPAAKPAPVEQQGKTAPRAPAQAPGTAMPEAQPQAHAAPEMPGPGMAGPGTMPPYGPPFGMQPQQQQPASAPGAAAAPWPQPPYPAPHWAQPHGQPQQPPMYPGYGPQPGQPAPYTQPAQPAAPSAPPRSSGASTQPDRGWTPPAYPGNAPQGSPLSHYTDVETPAPQAGNTDTQPPAPVQPVYPGYGMWPGQAAPYGQPAYPVYPGQPLAPAPDKSSAASQGSPQVAPGAPTTTSAKGGKKP